MNTSTILRVIVLGAAAIFGIIAIQTYWVLSTWNINEEEFNKKVNLALYNVAGSLADMNNGTLPPRNIINQRSGNYYVVNIEDEIDANNLEYFLQKEFEALALNVDFEYAVFDCTTDEMVYGNYCSYSPGERKDVELGNLPKYDKFTYYFGVKFPTRSGYLLGKMQLSIFFSGILLITLLFFAYSMFVILRQKRLSEMQKDFINNMTHEFKTPISTIKISADVLLNHPRVIQDKRLHQYAGIIREQNLRLNKQVEKVLQLASIEKDTLRLNKEQLDLGVLLQEALESVAVQIEKRGGTLNVCLFDGELPLEADPLHLTNILYNLLDNAIKYCRESPVITVTAEPKGNQIELRIVDNGIGISQEHLKRVLDKFYRVPTGNIHNVKGFGLGLFYVKNICIVHGWKLRLESEENRGTCVQILFPKS